MFVTYLSLFRVKHYVKNFLIFLPLIFFDNFFDVNLLKDFLITFISFCLMSSAVYILNDLFDLNSDKLHIIKKKRVLPSGKVSLKLSRILMFILALFSFLLSLKVDLVMSLILILYFILNVFYSFYFKNFFFFDALILAVGFILRVLCGFILTKTFSFLLAFFIFFLSLVLIFLKRKIELKISSNTFTLRKSIQNIKPVIIDFLISFSLFLSFLFHIVFVLKLYFVHSVILSFVLIILFCLFLLRLLFVVFSIKTFDDIFSLFEKDLLIKILIFLYFSTILIANFFIY